MNPDYLPQDGPDIRSEEERLFDALNEAERNLSSEEVEYARERVESLDCKIGNLQDEIADARTTRQKQDRIVSEAAEKVAAARSAIKHYYESFHRFERFERSIDVAREVAAIADEDPDVASAVAALADDLPATRDASRDEEGHDVPTLEKVCNVDSAATYYSGAAAGGMVGGEEEFIDTPIPDDPAAGDGVDGQTDGSQFQALYDQAEQPAAAVRTIVGSASDVSDADLAEARVKDQREAMAKERYDDVQSCLPDGPDLYAGREISLLEADLDDRVEYPSTFLNARRDWQNEKLRREAEQKKTEAETITAE